jgi:hypothetical protein
VAQFFGQHASPAVHAELRGFAAARGLHPVAGAGALLDEPGLRGLPLREALDNALDDALDEATSTPPAPEAPRGGRCR